MKTLRVALLFPALLPLAHGAISFTAVGVYDDVTNGNVVDQSQTTLTAAVHGANVLAAFGNGTGGVVNFDNGTGGTNGTWNIAYGSGKTLVVGTSAGQVNMLTSDVALIKATPISGNSYYRLGGTTTTLSFGTTLLSEFGLTLLARNTTRTLNNITVTLSDGTTATIAGVSLTANTVQSSSDYLTESGSGIDRFFGYTAPEGKAITQIVINGGDNLVMDDFGFVTSPIVIPEPSVALLAVAGAAVGITRRRRI